MGLLRAVTFELDTVTAGVEVTTNNFGSGSAPTIVTSPVNTGTYAMKHTASASNSSSMYQFSSGGIGVAFVRGWFQVATATGYSTASTVILDLGTSAAAYGGIFMNSSGQLGINYNVGTTNTYDTTLTSAVSKDVWHYLDLSIDTTTANSQVVTGYLDGVLINTKTGNRTLAANSLTLGVWGIGLRESATGTVYFDDLQFNDNTGSSQNTYAGESQIAVFRPSAAGDSNTFASATGGTAGTANNFTRVNEVTPDTTTTFNQATAVNQSDLFTVSGPTIPSGSTINYVALSIQAADSTTGISAVTAVKLQIEKTSGGTISQGTAYICDNTTFGVNKTATPRNYTLIAYNDPDGSPWTLSTIASMQIGYQETAFSTSHIRVSNVWADVSYTLSSAVSASVTQVAASVTATGGTQTIATVQDPSVVQSGASVTASGGIQTILAHGYPYVVLDAPSDTATGVSTDPALQFTGTDPQGDNLIYELQLDTVNTFDSHGGSPLLDKTSDIDAGFSI